MRNPAFMDGLDDCSIAEAKSVVDRIHHYLSAYDDDRVRRRREGHDDDTARLSRRNQFR